MSGFYFDDSKVGNYPEKVICWISKAKVHNKRIIVFKYFFQRIKVPE